MGLQYTPEQLVMVDESSFDRRATYRGYAYALKGIRAVRKCFFLRGKRCVLAHIFQFQWIDQAILRYSVLPALSLDGMVYCHIVEGSYNTARFMDFIEGLPQQMQPYPSPKSVIVMDNCRIHKAPQIQQMIETRSVATSVSSTRSS